MRILFVGNADSPLILNLALELKRVRPGLVIDIISESATEFGKSRIAFDRVVVPKGGGWARRTKGVKFFWFVWQYHKALSQVSATYDVVHVFYLSAIWGVLALQLGSKAGRFIVTLFGSDVYGSSRILRRFQVRLLDVADCFTASNPHTLNVARQRFDRPLLPSRELLFGLRSLEHLVGLGARDRQYARQRFGVPHDQVVISCGYNGSPNQNHHHILGAISALPWDLRKQCFLLFPMTTGGSDDYHASVKDSLNATGIQYLILDARLDDAEVALLRMASDILVQVQTTDQLSGSMLEHLYAGSVLLTGAWLPYGILREKGLVYWTTDSMEELAKDLAECVAQLPVRSRASERNRELVWQMTAWEKTVPLWSALYD